MKTSLVTILSMIGVIAAAWLNTEQAEDAQTRRAIMQAAADYGDGWYEGDAERMERALHPELAKRVVFTRPKIGRNGLGQMGAMTLVQYTKAGGGKNAPVEKRPATITILAIFENAAVVKVDGPEWIDFLHMAKWNGR